MQERSTRRIADTNTRSAEKRGNFKRLAVRRTNSIIDRMRVLGNLANTSAYSYSEDEIDKIFGAIEEELRIVKARFRGAQRRRFRFDD